MQHPLWLVFFFTKISNLSEDSVDQFNSRFEASLQFLHIAETQNSESILNKQLTQLRQVFDVLSSFNRQDKLKSASMAICNELASIWQCERVSLGLLKGQYIHLNAMSFTEEFKRKMKLIHDIECAMEESLD